jgi:hypothetical protein
VKREARIYSIILLISISNYFFQNSILIDDQPPKPTLKVLKEANNLDEYYYPITTPFSLYRYTQLSIRVKKPLCFTQVVMVALFKDCINGKYFICKNITIFTTGTFEGHYIGIGKVMTVLSTSGFSVKPNKFDLATQSVGH